MAALALLTLASDTLAETVTVPPSKDTTIYGDGSASLSSGAGAYLFAGLSGERRILRSLIAFDLSGRIPAGARINSATLTLNVNTPLNHAVTVRLHRVLADWGEGASVAPMGGAGGGAATNGDATWNHRFFNTTAWATPGGDFSSAVSAAQPVSGRSGAVTFSSAGLAADVQAWIDNPASNFGWILVAENEAALAVRFASRQGAPAPVLVVDYTAGGANTPPAFTAQPASQTAPAGATVTFSAAAGGSPAPSFQWQRNGAPIAGATNAILTLNSIGAADTGTYAVVATNAAGSVTSATATLTVTTAGPSTARLSNLSVRAAMAADQTLIVGFSVRGGSRPVLIRGVGPTLQAFGVTDAMQDPRLEFYTGSTLAAQNDDWQNGPALGAGFGFPLLANGRDAALLQPVDGTRSILLKGTGAGIALVELYDTGAESPARLVNVSARNQVGTGDNVLIFGFVVSGAGARNVLVRAIGPRLGQPPFELSGVLADPRLEVFRAGTAAAIAGNDNWDSSLAATFTTVAAFELVNGSRDAALVTSLAAGEYTVQVSGVNNTTGEALVEIYELP